MKDYKIFEIYPHFSCNQKCIHCFNGEDFRKNNKGLSFEKISKSLFKMRKKGCDWLSILGGEPTVYSDIFKTVSLAKKLGYERIMTFSNGIKYSDFSFAKRMKKEGLTDTCISVHGDNAELHEFITQVKGSFKAVLKAVENLKKLKINITFIIVINRRNYKFLPRMVKKFISLGVKNYMIFALKYQGRMSASGYKQAAVNLSEAFSKIDETFKIFNKNNLKLPTLLHVTPCILPKYHINLDNYKPKESSMLIQDGKEYGLKSAHKGFMFLSSCRQCVFYDGCSGFDPGYAKIFGTKEFKPVKKLK